MRKAAIALALGFLAYKGLQFYVATIEHFAFDISEANFGRLWPNRLWLLLHIAGGTAALFAGPFQLWSGLRNSHRLIHRWTGRIYVAGVLLGGAAAFYLSFFSQPRSFGVALFALGVAWWVSVGTAVLAIKQYRIAAHKAWMIRGYVVTSSFVTFRMLIELPLWSFAGPSRLAVVLWLSWVAPLAVTEFLLRAGSSEARRGWMRKAGVLCAICLIAWSPVAACQTTDPAALPGTLRDHLKNERFDIVTSIRGFPIGVRDGLRTLFGTPGLDIAEPGAGFQATEAIGDSTLPLRRLIAGGCSRDHHCLVYYERGGGTRTWRVALFHWTPDVTRFEWGGNARGGLATIDDVRNAVLAGAVNGPATSW